MTGGRRRLIFSVRMNEDEMRDLVHAAGGEIGVYIRRLVAADVEAKAREMWSQRGFSTTNGRGTGGR